MQSHICPYCVLLYQQCLFSYRCLDTCWCSLLWWQLIPYVPCLKEIALPETGIYSAFYVSDIVCALTLNLNTSLLASNLWTVWNSKDHMCSNLSVLMLWYHFALHFISCTCFSCRTLKIEVSLTALPFHLHCFSLLPSFIPALFHAFSGLFPLLLASVY